MTFQTHIIGAGGRKTPERGYRMRRLAQENLERQVIAHAETEIGLLTEQVQRLKQFINRRKGWLSNGTGRNESGESAAREAGDRTGQLQQR